MSTLETIFLIASLAGVVFTIIFAIVASISSRRSSMSAGKPGFHHYYYSI